MKKILTIIICSILLTTGCNKKNTEEKELYMLGHTLDDGRIVHSTFSVPYINKNNKSYLGDALLNNIITIDEFLNDLDHVDALNDGGSEIYKYNKSNKTYGNEEFYVIACNSLDNIKDIFIAKKRDSLENKCNLKIDDLEGVSMIIKDVTNVGAKVIITDKSDRKNIYGESYKIEKKEDNIWTELESINDLVFTSIGYNLKEDNTLTFDINWEYLYGKLESGEYRILKDTSIQGEGTIHYISVEFIIKQDVIIW